MLSMNAIKITLHTSLVLLRAGTESGAIMDLHLRKFSNGVVIVTSSGIKSYYPTGQQAIY